MSTTYKKRMQRKKEYIDSRIHAANIDKKSVCLISLITDGVKNFVQDFQSINNLNALSFLSI